MKTIAVIGPGAVGSVIAYELGGQLFGRNESYVTLMMDKISHHLNVSSLIFNKQVFDYIFIAVKSTQLESILPSVKLMTHSDSKIILCQNGIGQEQLFDLPVIPAVVYISGQKQGQHIKHFRDKTLIVPFSDKSTPLLQLTTGNNLDIQLSETFVKERWFKLLVNLGINTVTALAKNSTQIMKLSEVQQFTRQLLSEGIVIARHEGIHFEDNVIDEIMSIYTGYPDDMGTSMYYDVLNNQMTEYEYIQGTCLRLAQEHQLNVPAVEMATTLLKAYQYKKK